MVSGQHLLGALGKQRLLAIIRGSDTDAVVTAGVTLLECGIECLEVSLTSADAFTAIERLVAEAGTDGLIGAGTVLTKDDALRARDAGAHFAVTPGLGEGMDAAVGVGLPVVGGALTPTEIIAASTRCAAVKLFPASLGGPDYLHALRAPFPDVPFVPVGGVDATVAVAYLAAGALAVGVGSPLVGDAADGGDLHALRDRAREFVQRVAAAR